MVTEQLALGFVGLELGAEVLDVDDTRDAFPQILGELFACDDVLVRALRVGNDLDAY